MQVRQDKCLKLLEAQTRWNPLPLLTLRHFVCQRRWILTDAARVAQTQCSCGLADNPNFRKTRNQLMLKADGVSIRPADLAFLSPCATSKLKRFGDYPTDLKPEPVPTCMALPI